MSIAFALGNVILGSIEYLQVVFLAQLSGPATIFYNTVRDSADRDSSE